MRTRVLPTLIGAVLVLSACAGPEFSEPVRVEAGPPDAWPAEVVVTPGGEVLVHFEQDADDNPWVAVVDGARGEVRTEAPARLLDLQADAVAVEGDHLLLAGWGQWDDPLQPWAYGIWVVEPDTGEVAGFRRIDAVPPGIEDAVAVFTPDGALVVAVERDDGTPPVLHVVDPATGAATRSAVPDLGGLSGHAELVVVADVAVSADGTQLVFELVPWDLDGAGDPVPVLVRTHADLSPAGPPVALGTVDSDAFVHDVAITDEGRVYAGLADDTTSPGRLVVVDPGAGEPRTLEEFTDLPLAVEVAGEELWVVGYELTLSRVDPTDGSVLAATELCTDRPGGPVGLAVTPDGAAYVLARCNTDVPLWWVRS
ncbi:hypothetical protein ACI8AF_16900 [Blastococcus sp. SYSU D00669]